MSAPDEAAKTAKHVAVYDPTSPAASPRSGYVAPIETRFDGKAGPGRPKGSHSARAAARRRARKGWETDTEVEEGEEPIGIEARKLADELIEAAFAGDKDRVKAIADVIAEIEGKPQERVENTGSMTVKRIELDGVA